MAAGNPAAGLSLAAFTALIERGSRAELEGKTMGELTAVLLGSPEVVAPSPLLGRANIYLSTSDADLFLDVVDAMAEWQARQPADEYFYAFNALATDALAPFEKRRRDLSTTILDAGRVLLIMDLKASAAYDMCCVLEVSLAQELCISLEVAMAPRFLRDYLSLLPCDANAVMSMFCINIETVSTPDDEDSACVSSAISDGVGYPRVNQAIVHALQEWAVEQGRIKIASMDEDQRWLSPYIAGLANLLQSLGRLAEAEPLIRASVVVRRRRLGDEHRKTLSSVENLASLLHDQGKFAEAESLYHEALHSRQRTEGSESPRYLTTLFNYATLLWSRGRVDEAMPLFEEELATMRRVLGETHSDTLISMANMGQLLQEQNRLGDAEGLIRTTLAIRQRKLGADHSGTLASLTHLAKLLQAKKLFGEADLIFQRVLDVRRRTLGDGSMRTIAIIHSIGLLRRDQGDLGAALDLLGEAAERGREALGCRHPDVFRFMNDAACVLLARDRIGDALALLAEAAPGMQDALGRDHPDTRGVTTNWASALAALACSEESAAAIALLPPIPAEVERHPHALSSAPTSAVAASMRLPQVWSSKCGLCHAARLWMVYWCTEAGCSYAVCMRCYTAIKD